MGWFSAHADIHGKQAALPWRGGEMVDYPTTFPTSLGGFDRRSTPFLRTDVLVVGAGIAGCAAALAAAEAE